MKWEGGGGLILHTCMHARDFQEMMNGSILKRTERAATCAKQTKAWYGIISSMTSFLNKNPPGLTSKPPHPHPPTHKHTHTHHVTKTTPTTPPPHQSKSRTLALRPTPTPAPAPASSNPPLNDLSFILSSQSLQQSFSISQFVFGSSVTPQVGLSHLKTTGLGRGGSFEEEEGEERQEPMGLGCGSGSGGVDS